MAWEGVTNYKHQIRICSDILYSKCVNLFPLPHFFRLPVNHPYDNQQLKLSWLVARTPFSFEQSYAIYITFNFFVTVLTIL